MRTVRGDFPADSVFEAVDPIVERVSHRPAGFSAQTLDSILPVGGFLGTRVACSKSAMNVESQFPHAFGERSFPRLGDGLKHLDSQPSASYCSHPYRHSRKPGEYYGRAERISDIGTK